MQIYTEKKAEEFLKKNGFNVIESFYIKGEKKLDDLLRKIQFPIVMKVSGKKIIHKGKINGVRLNISDYGFAMKSFNELMKIENAEGVLIQKQISGKELFLGLKKTPEFGHVIGFGTGGSDVEKLADVSFRTYPLNEKDLSEIIKGTEIGRSLNRDEKIIIVDNLLKLCALTEKFPDIEELDINPLILTEIGESIIVDARISWE